MSLLTRTPPHCMLLLIPHRKSVPVFEVYLIATEDGIGVVEELLLYILVQTNWNIVAETHTHEVYICSNQSTDCDVFHLFTCTVLHYETVFSLFAFCWGYCILQHLLIDKTIKRFKIFEKLLIFKIALLYIWS